MNDATAGGNSAIGVRDACEEDLAALDRLRSGGALHRDRLNQADGVNLRYLMVLHRDKASGFGCLVLGQPKEWPAMRYVPQMIDLFIGEPQRGKGLGSALIGEMERMARERGFTQMFLGVDPVFNEKALRLYQRLGYVALEEEPRLENWSFVDSDGVKHKGTDLVLHMRKELAGG